MDENPDVFVTALREVFVKPPLAALRLRPEFSMLGRTYGSGFEPNLEDFLLQRPRRTILGEGARWAIWYPLRRLGAFAQLQREEQGQILDRAREEADVIEGPCEGERARKADSRLGRHDRHHSVVGARPSHRTHRLASNAHGAHPGGDCRG